MRSESDIERRTLIVACAFWAVILAGFFTFVYLGPARFYALLDRLWP